MAAFFVKKRRAYESDEIDPEEMENDDLMLEEEGSDDDDIPPPPPMEANDEGIEIDETFLQLPQGMDQEADDNASTSSEGLVSV